VDLIYDIYLVAACLGWEKDLILDLADVIDACVAGSVDLDDVDTVASCDLLAVGADPTRYRGRPCLTVQGTCKDTGRRSLADSTGAAEKICVCNPLLLDRILDG